MFAIRISIQNAGNDLLPRGLNMFGSCWPAIGLPNPKVARSLKALPDRFLHATDNS